MATKFYLAEIPDDFPATIVKFENMTKPLLAIPAKMVDGKPITIVGYINAGQKKYKANDYGFVEFNDNGADFAQFKNANMDTRYSVREKVSGDILGYLPLETGELVGIVREKEKPILLLIIAVIAALVLLVALITASLYKMVNKPLAFSEPIGSDDAVIDADDTIAADTPDSDSNDTAWLSASKDTSTQVTAEVDSFYTLTVPEEITLNGSDGTGIQTGTIPVTLMGDIPLKGTVQVKTTATPLQAKGSVDVPMTIATPKVEWNRTEMLGDGTSSDYSVSAVLAPGDWTGTVTFECLVQ